MRHISIFINEIDYGILLGRIKMAVGNKSSVKNQGRNGRLLKILRPFVGIINVLPNIFIENQIMKQAAKFGIYTTVYIENNKAKIKALNERKIITMLNLSASIEKIDYQKLINTIQGSSASKGGSLVVPDVIKIIEPFLAETMKTIPDAAIAELFMLLGRDKIVEMAQDYGVKISHLSMTDSHPVY